MRRCLMLVPAIIGGAIGLALLACPPWLGCDRPIGSALLVAGALIALRLSAVRTHRAA